MVFCGGGGLLLLTQADSIDAATRTLNKIFIFVSSFESLGFPIPRLIFDSSEANSTAAVCACGCPQLSYRCASYRRAYTVPEAREYWIYHWPDGA